MARLLPIVLTVLAALGLWYLLQYSPVVAPTAELDLLRRRPDATLEQTGRVEPHAKRQFGSAGLWGWSTIETLVTEAGLAYVPATQPDPILELQAVDARDRQVELTLFGLPFEAALGDVRVSLNGETKSEWSFALTAEPSTIVLTTEAPLWRAGANQLQFKVPKGTRGWDTVCLASVKYDDRAFAVDVDPYEGRLALDPGSAVRYAIDARSPAELIIEGTAGAPGTLALGFENIDPGTGRESTDGPRTELAVEADFVRVIPLPGLEPGEIHGLDLAWHTDSDARFEVTRLGIRGAAPKPRPHVVFISIDTLAARHMSVYGYERDTTPRIRAMAEEAVVFERAIANAPWTLPSYLSVMTGLYPHAHRLPYVERLPGEQMVAFDNWQIAPNRWTLAEALRARGYQTGGFVDTAWLLDQFRFAQGFDLYDVSPAREPFHDPNGGIVMIDQHVGMWLERIEQNAPTFLFVHALDAHGPYWPDAPWRGSFHEGWDESALRQVPAGGAYQTYQQIPDWMAKTVVDLTLDPETGELPPGRLDEYPPFMPVEPLVSAYDEAIAKTDEYIGRILDRLREADMYDDAVVVISADHGESFAHDFYSHGRMFEDIVRVPLIVKLPKGRFGGQRVETSVQLVDIFPTIVELAGAAPHGELHGRSLVASLSGGPLAPRPTFSEGGHCEQYMVEHDGWKLVRSFPARTPSAASVLTDPRLPRAWLEERVPGYAPLLVGPFTEKDWDEFELREDYERLVADAKAQLEGPFDELYYLPDDPDELEDLAAREPTRVTELLALIDEHRALGAASQKLAQPLETVPFDADHIERLRELGYLGNDDE
ncbi:MAG: sulfatase [Planctomycetota bacterium]